MQCRPARCAARRPVKRRPPRPEALPLNHGSSQHTSGNMPGLPALPSVAQLKALTEDVQLPQLRLPQLPRLDVAALRELRLRELSEKERKAAAAAAAATAAAALVTAVALVLRRRRRRAAAAAAEQQEEAPETLGPCGVLLDPLGTGKAAAAAEPAAGNGVITTLAGLEQLPHFRLLAAPVLAVRVTHQGEKLAAIQASVLALRELKVRCAWVGGLGRRQAAVGSDWLSAVRLNSRLPRLCCLAGTFWCQSAAAAGGSRTLPWRLDAQSVEAVRGWPLCPATSRGARMGACCGFPL